MSERDLTGISPGGDTDERDRVEEAKDRGDTVDDVLEEVEDTDVLESIKTLREKGFLEDLEEELQEGPGLEGIAIEPETIEQATPGEFRLDFPNIPDPGDADVDVEPPEVNVDVDTSTLAGLLQLNANLVEKNNQITRNSLQTLIQISQILNQLPSNERQRLNLVSDSTTSAGSDAAAEVELGPFRKEFEVFYNLEAAGDDIIIEVSKDGNTWRDFAELTVPSSGDRDVGQGNTKYNYVRAYPGSGFSDTNVNLVEIVAKGG